MMQSLPINEAVWNAVILIRRRISTSPSYTTYVPEEDHDGDRSNRC
jgi:hypothetical protein